MTKLWVLLWISSSNYCASDVVLWEDRYSVRGSSTEIVEWMQILRKAGKGFHFSILEATQWYDDPDETNADKSGRFRE